MSKKNDTQQDDIVFEPEESESGSSFSSTPEKKLRERIKKAVEEKQEYLDGWQRAKADLVNARREFDEERQKIASRTQENFIIELLPVFDSFDMAFANKDTWESVDKNWRVGVEYIHNQLHSIMKEYGVERIEVVGKKFDPTYHLAVRSEETDDKKKDDIVSELVHNGYTKDGRVLRPAQVVVYEYGDGRKENGEK